MVHLHFVVDIVVEMDIEGMLAVELGMVVVVAFVEVYSPDMVVEAFVVVLMNLEPGV